MRERIQKILSSRGVCSRRAAEKMILAGRITCNGTICALGETADVDEDEILLDGKPLPIRSASVYVALNKPRGYVTSMSDDKGRKDVSQLVADCPERVYPIGRLDMDSEGLLLFTNDGNFANRLMHPSHEIDKIYRVFVSGYSHEGLEQLGEPIVLDGYRIRRPSVKVVSSSGEKAELLITIHEGRNRQVRRMCAAVGMQVVRLVRVQEGCVKLGNLSSGKWRYLREDEVNKLME